MCPISSGPLIHQIMHIQCQSIVGVDGSVTTSSYEVSRLFTDFGMMSENSISHCCPEASSSVQNVFAGLSHSEENCNIHSEPHVFGSVLALTHNQIGLDTLGGDCNLHDISISSCLDPAAIENVIDFACSIRNVNGNFCSTLFIVLLAYMKLNLFKNGIKVIEFRFAFCVFHFLHLHLKSLAYKCAN